VLTKIVWLIDVSLTMLSNILNTRHAKLHIKLQINTLRVVGIW